MIISTVTHSSRGTKPGLGKGLKKKAYYPLFVDKGGGPQKWISDEGKGLLWVDKKNIIVNIINSQKVDKPRGGG